MKKARMYPFERNRYFYGKLLTVRDFESEQKYFNDKRRLLNRLLFGSGVVAGMQVIGVDDKTITVEMGVAIDYIGREIVIPAPVTLKLSMIDGFTNNEYKKNVYLYVAYDEKGREPVHSVGNSSVRAEEVSEYNRYLESFRLFVKEEAPAPMSLEHTALSEDVTTLYYDSQVRITQRMPKYVNPGDVIDVTIVVEKTLQAPRVKLSFPYETDSLRPVGKEEAYVKFEDPGDGQETEYRYAYSLKAAENPGTVAKLSVQGEAIELYLGDNRIPIDVSVKQSVDIIEQPVISRVLQDWHERSLDQAADGYADQHVCLAKIGLLQLGPTYMIEKVERVPFGEYIPNAALLQKLTLADASNSSHKFYAESEAYDLAYGNLPELDVTYHPDRNTFSFKMGIPKPQTIKDEMATGTIEVPLDVNAKPGMRFFFSGKKNFVSDAIEHGLGEGQVTIIVGLEEPPVEGAVVQPGKSQKMYYGSSEVFKGTEFEAELPNVLFGTVVDPDRGTFRIGMKLKEPTEAAALRVRWWAFKKLDDDLAQLPAEALKALEVGLGEAAASQE